MVEKLLAIVQLKARVRRQGIDREIPVEEIVPGDVVILSAGDIIPGDGVILESKDLFVDEATLTGETFPVEKNSGPAPAEAPLSQRPNSVFMGTHVVSGSAQILVVCTGKSTEFGQVSERLVVRPPLTEFERGVRRFGFFLMEVTLILVILIFAGNVFLKRHVMDSFLFALALAVGLTPQLLPAIITINLAHGANRMAAKGDRETPGRHRKLRQHECALLRQDGYHYRRHGQSALRAWTCGRTKRENPAVRVS